MANGGPFAIRYSPDCFVAALLENDGGGVRPGRARK
jgi:hypothetical protein